MKTTLDLPDDLIRAIKIRAAQEDKKLKDYVTEILRRGLATEDKPAVPHRVQLPFIHGRPARPGEEMTPERLAEILIDQEARWHMDQ